MSQILPSVECHETKAHLVINNPRLDQLTLHGFRNFKQVRLSLEQSQMVMLYGPNGSGKTNLLEAISLFSPGRGMRRAKLNEMLLRFNQDDVVDNTSYGSPPVLSQDFKIPQSFSVHGKLISHYGPIEVGVGWNISLKRQMVKLNGVELKNQGKLSEYLSFVWLTPAMDRLFQEGSSARRRFLDRLIFGFDPAHSGRLNSFDLLMRNRLKLLSRDGQMEDDLLSAMKDEMDVDLYHSSQSSKATWLNSLEHQMVERGVAIAAARLQMAQRLDVACKLARGSFPRAKVEVTGFLEDALLQYSCAEVESRYEAELKNYRQRDGQSGMTHIGPHRSDLLVTHLEKNMPADMCSTGEQKALLLSVVLADMVSQKAEQGQTPVLLLDEVAAHLDPKRRDELFELLMLEQGQVWMTGADPELFNSLTHGWLKNRVPCAAFHVEAGLVTPHQIA